MRFLPASHNHDRLEPRIPVVRAGFGCATPNRIGRADGNRGAGCAAVRADAQVVSVSTTSATFSATMTVAITHATTRVPSALTSAPITLRRDV
ncbi:hypothetical protein EDF24_0336 [Curtobacterium sp. PhB130]|nr:hypothetical protein EDF24_0336 [Curtobacterium sp. PhB130]